jgi:hypothetical protein
LFDGERSLGLTGIKWVFNIISKHFQCLFCFSVNFDLTNLLS